MFRSFRYVSSTLALVMFLTTVINAVVVMCVSGPDHQAFELIGHQDQLEGHTVHPLSFTDPSIGHESHPEICTDTPLFSDIPLQRDNLAASCEDRVHQVVIAYPLDELSVPVFAFNSQDWSASLYASSLRPPTDDLASIRLLI